MYQAAAQRVQCASRPPMTARPAAVTPGRAPARPPRPASMRATAALASLLLLPALAAAQRPAARVEIDHVTGESRLIVRRGTAEDTTDLGDEPVVRLHRAIPVD